MNDRLHLAATLWSRGVYYKTFDEALRDADALIARELETRPKCEHRRVHTYSNGRVYCIDCSTEGKP